LICGRSGEKGAGMGGGVRWRGALWCGVYGHRGGVEGSEVGLKLKPSSEGSKNHRH